ncbi:hypothetical protein H8S90_17445 [Olivibacter sp. SDN3]|uniref:hypothetical protein n=1 Tax=Olivibacter sp. SDN3 TaxID=2764720 RepID=UPI0016515725|nr:hypothetical protein [Olivibacter sp. SDN3]QNL48560.1 hypothetical protein H8S90_17445 [Olivibacter sp. SDN3]
MNANKRVFLFIFFSLILYLFFSYINLAYHKTWKLFDRINLIADIVVHPNAIDDITVRDTLSDELLSKEIDYKPSSSTVTEVKDSLQKQIQEVTEQSTAKRSRPISLANKITRKEIIGFSDDTVQSALTQFAEKIYRLKKGENVRVRIAYLGDSMIEGDLLSKTLRNWLQKTYGGIGVGFVPITSQVAQFRQTAQATYSDGWKDLNFKNSKNKHLFLSGHVFFSSGADWIKVKDNTTRDTTIILDKYLFYGPSTDTSQITVNGKAIKLSGKAPFNKQNLLSDKSKTMHIAFSDRQLPVYGLSFESEQGIIVDNFSFRGISGLEFGRIDTGFLQAIQQSNSYDLIIFQYGVNVIYDPEETNFNWYKRAAIPVINKMKTCFPEADILIIGTGDRAFRYPEGYQSAIGIEELVSVQASLASQTKCSFFSLYAAMGGKNSMVNWANQTPSLANKDYVHPNALGANILGKNLFDAIKKDVDRFDVNRYSEEH